MSSPNDVMMNVYSVKLTKSVKVEPAHHFGGKETIWLYVTASSFENALAAVAEKYPGAEVSTVNLMNYTGVPIVAGK